MQMRVWVWVRVCVLGYELRVWMGLTIVNQKVTPELRCGCHPVTHFPQPTVPRVIVRVMMAMIDGD